MIYMCVFSPYVLFIAHVDVDGFAKPFLRVYNVVSIVNPMVA